VAAIGLDPHKHLGKSIRQMQPLLRSLRDRFGCNVCGEGGEYETLTLDCPAFKHGRIVLDDWEVGAQWISQMNKSQNMNLLAAEVGVAALRMVVTNFRPIASCRAALLIVLLSAGGAALP
jgi:diphthamide synthase (EF-2-diphthine--ammonia ligase)